MSTSLKKIKIVAIIIIIAWMLSVILQGTCVKAASKMLRKTDKTTYAIATTSGELCSTTVSTFLTENVDKKVAKRQFIIIEVLVFGMKMLQLGQK